MEGPSILSRRAVRAAATLYAVILITATTPERAVRTERNTSAADKVRYTGTRDEPTAKTYPALVRTSPFLIKVPAIGGLILGGPLGTPFSSLPMTWIAGSARRAIHNLRGEKHGPQEEADVAQDRGL